MVPRIARPMSSEALHALHGKLPFGAWGAESEKVFLVASQLKTCLCTLRHLQPWRPARGATRPRAERCCMIKLHDTMKAEANL